MKMLVIVISLVSLINLNLCFADDSVLIDKGQPAPFAGLLMTKEKAKEVRIQLIELDAVKAENTSLEKTIDLYKNVNDLNNKKLSILTEQNDSLSNELSKAKSLTSWEKIGWFTLGVLATGLAVYGASELRH